MGRLPGWAQALVIALLVLLAPAAGAARQAPASDYVVRWRVATGGAVQQPPVVAGRVVYSASQDGILSAVDLELGTELWSADTGSGFPLGPVVTDGVVYVANQAGPLSAFDAATGARLWSADDVSSLGGGAPAAAAGMVYVSKIAPDGAVLTAVDAASGVIAWTASLGRATHGSPAALEGRVFATGYVTGSTPDDAVATVFALDARTGAEAWRSQAGTPLVLAGAAADLVLATGHDGLVALDATTGQPVWAFQPGPDAPGGTWAVDGPAVGDSVVYAGTAIAMGGNPNPSQSGMVYALDVATGTPVWATEIVGGVRLGPALAHDIVAVAAGLGRGLYTLDTTSGEVTWYYPNRTGTPVGLSATDGWLVVADADGSITGWKDLVS